MACYCLRPETSCLQSFGVAIRAHRVNRLHGFSTQIPAFHYRRKTHGIHKIQEKESWLKEMKKKTRVKELLITLDSKGVGLPFYLCDDDWFDTHLHKPVVNETSSSLKLQNHILACVAFESKTPAIFIRRSTWKIATRLQREVLLIHEFHHVLLGHCYRKTTIESNHKEMRRILPFVKTAETALAALVRKCARVYLETYANRHKLTLTPYTKQTFRIEF